MWLVHMIHSYDINGRASVFDNKVTAEEYLRWLWLQCCRAELAEKSDLVQSECYCGDDYAKLSWADGCFTEFVLLKVSEPYPEFKAQRPDD